MRCVLKSVGIVVIFATGCGVPQSDFVAEQNRRLAAENEAANTLSDHNRLKKQIQESEAERKKWQESAVDLSDSLQKIANGAEGFENLRIRFAGVIKPTSISPGGIEQDLNGRKAYTITLEKKVSADARDAIVRELKREADVRKSKRDTQAQAARDAEALKVKLEADEYKVSRDAIGGDKRGSVQNKLRLNADAERKLKLDADAALKAKREADELKFRRDIESLEISEQLLTSKAQSALGSLPTSFFILSETMRNDLLARGSSAGFPLVGEGGSSPPAWDATLFFIVRGSGRRNSLNTGRPELYGQLYRVELFKDPNLSGEPAVVVEDEELTANPVPPPPSP